MSTGKLLFQLYYGDESYPITDAKIILLNSNNVPLLMSPISVDENGKSEAIELYTLDKTLTESPMEGIAPYITYSAIIKSPYFKDVLIEGIQIFDGITSIEKVPMVPKLTKSSTTDDFVIPEHGLLENETSSNITALKPVINTNKPKILTNPIIPEKITVHLGSPNSNAANVTVPFADYIKNVASSEIYPTWPENAIRANIYAQISFTLNRIFTEWYRSRGYNFDITNSTAYDHYFVNGRDIFDNISKIVDDIFNDYISRVSFLEPLLAQYCNGTTVTCDGLSQWGTVDYAKQGLTPFEILKKYYSNNIELRSADIVSGTNESYPGTPLKLGSNNDNVKTIQTQLNRIRKNYPAITNISPVDGIFNATTEKSVKDFQKIFNLTADGIVGKSTWYKISQIYVGVKNLAELESEGEKLPIPTTPPSTVIRKGSYGKSVEIAQFFLACIAAFYDEIPTVKITGTFDDSTENSVRSFQSKFGLAVDGIIGKKTWNKLYEVFLSIKPYIFTEGGNLYKYPGYILREGSSGENVKIIQRWLSSISNRYTSIPNVDVDGKFGPKTKAAVIAFQKAFNLAPDGLVGKLTWDKLYSVYLEIVSNK